MNPFTLVLALCLVASFGCTKAQLAGWSAQQLPQFIQPAQQQVVPQQLQLAAPFNSVAQGLQQVSGSEPQRQLTASDLQNQVQALGAQLAAANRQIQFYQQKLAAQPQQSAPVESAPLNQPLAPQQQPQPQPQQQQQQQQQLSQLQQQLQQQMQLQAALAAQQQQLAFQQQQSQTQPQQQAEFSPFESQQMAVQQQRQQQLQQQQQQQQAAQFPSAAPQFQPAQQQQQPQVSTLIDNSASEPNSAGQAQFLASQRQQQFQQQQHQQQLQQQQQPQPTTSSSIEPASIEPSLAAQQLSTPASGQAQAPSRNDDKFSIGLGVLSPGYTQKFGNTELDFNQDKNGFSYTLSNNGHRNEPPPTPTTQKPAAAAAPAES